MAFYTPQDQLIHAQLFGIQPPEGVEDAAQPQLGADPTGLAPEPAPVDPAFQENMFNAPGLDLVDVELQPPGPIDYAQPQAQPLKPGERVSRATGVSMSGGGASRSRSDSRSGPVIVQKSRGKYQAPTDESIDAAAAGEQFQGLEAARNQADAIRSEQDAMAAYNAALAEDQAKVAEQDRQDAEDAAQADAMANAEADERIAGISNAVEAVKSMSVDPQRLWNEGGAANKTAGLVSAFIGGFLQPVLGTNTIQQTIDRAIDRDIDAQKSNIAGAQRNVSNLQMLNRLGLQQAETESEQREQDRLLRRASIVGMLQAETMKLQDPVLKAKADREIANLNAVNVKEMQAIRDKHAQRAQAKYQFEMQEHRARQAIAQRAAASRRSSRDARAGLALRERELDAKAAERAEAAQAKLKALQLNPETSGLRMQDGSPVTMRNDKEFQETSKQLASYTDFQTKAEVMKTVLAGRLAAPGTKERHRQNAAFSELIQAGGMKLSAQMSDKDVKIVKNARGGELDAMLRVAGDDVVLAVLEDFQAQKAAEGRALARTKAPPGQTWIYDPIIDPKVVEEFTGGTDPVPLSPEQHVAKITSPDVAPEEKAQSILTFLNAAQNERGGMFFGPDDPNVRAVVEASQDPEIKKFLPRELTGVQGEGEKVQVGRSVQGELNRLDALGTKKWHSTEMLDETETEAKRKLREAAERFNTIGGR